MAIIYSTNSISGISTDTKPTNISTGTTFFETDTKKTFRWDGSAWYDTMLSVNSGIGYTVGAGGAVSQLTSKATGVILNKLCGTITLNSAALASGAIVTFTVTDSMISATDVIFIQHDSVGTIGGYTIMPNTVAAGSFKISIRNNTAASLSEAIVLRFAIIKSTIN